MALDALLTTLYGSHNELSSIMERAFVPGGSIVTAREILKREEKESGYYNRPHSLVFLTSAAVVELVKLSGYAYLFATAVYYSLK